MSPGEARSALRGLWGVQGDHPSGTSRESWQPRPPSPPPWRPSPELLWRAVGRLSGVVRPARCRISPRRSPGDGQRAWLTGRQHMRLPRWSSRPRAGGARRATTHLGTGTDRRCSGRRSAVRAETVTTHQRARHEPPLAPRRKHTQDSSPGRPRRRTGPCVCGRCGVSTHSVSGFRADEPLARGEGRGKSCFPPALGCAYGGQWLPASSPLSVLWIRALGSFSPMISTFLPRWAYLASMASRAATEEASQMWAAERSMTTLSGSVT
ncbi:hypothetical protein FBY35_6704 [Streptomyces sp. SLBN-118]|nr:hypothetical protein FBY35_6704 [Streptomyces sp. SLBN-118]